MKTIHEQRILGVDISDASLEVMCLEKKLYGLPKIFGYGRMILPQGVVSDGQIRRPEILVEALKRLLMESAPQKIFHGFGIVSLPDSQVFMMTLHLPSKLVGQGLHQSILFELETSYPLRLSEHFYDYTILRKDNLFQDVFVALAPRHLVYGYLEVLRHARIFPLAIDIESLSIARSLLRANDKSKNVIIADIGARTTNLTLYESGSIREARTILSGGEKITQSIMAALNISWVEAENIKRKTNMYSNNAQKDARFCIETELRSIVYEIKKMVQHFLFSRSRDVDTVILAGGTALLPGIRKFFQSHLRQNVEIRNPLKKLNVSEKDRKNKRFLYFANVIGLALRALQKDPLRAGLNLIQSEKARRKVNV